MSSNDDQFLRRAFDAAYAAPGALRRLYRNTSRSTKIIVASVVVAVVMFFVITSVSFRVAEEIEWANRPPLESRIEAPYGLPERSAPDDTDLVFDQLVLYTQEEYNEVHVALAEVLREAEEPAEESTGEDGQPLPTATLTPTAIPTSTPTATPTLNPEVTVDPEATVEPEEPTIEPEATPEPLTEDEIMASYMARITEEEIISEMTASSVDPLTYFQIMPILDAYRRDFASELVSYHEVFGCLLTIENNRACNIKEEPVFMEAARYTGAANSFQIASVQYGNQAAAYDAVFELLYMSNRIGSLGNFGLLRQRDTNFFYTSSEEGLSLFVWTHNEWIFALAVEDQSQIEDIIALLYF